MAAHVPEPAGRRDEPERELTVRCCLRPVERGAESSWRRAISARAATSSGPAARSSASATTTSTCSAWRRRIASASGRPSSLATANSRTVASRPNDPVSDVRATRLLSTSAASVSRSAGQHRLDVRDLEGAREDRKPLEETSFGVAQERMAPVDRRRKRAMAFRCVDRAVPQDSRREPRRTSKSSGANSLVRAAASSIASGSPSSRAHSSAISPPLASSSTPTRPARSANSSAATSGGRPARACSISPSDGDARGS